MIYLDHAATTKLAPEVLEAMLPYVTEEYGNPGAIYRQGARARQAVTKAREQIAKLLGAGREEIFFTGSGTEADNWALKAVAEEYEEKGRHIITTKIEHHAVLHTCEYLEKKGFEITYLDVDAQGLVSVEEVERAIRPDTILLSIMFANNEVGTIQPIAEIGSLAQNRGVLFHTDAVQAFGQIPVDVGQMGIDLLSASAHKVNGPKGVGCLYIKSGVRIGSFLHGGAQERSRRAGTENVPGIVGFGAAAVLAKAQLAQKMDKEYKMRDYMTERLLKEIPECSLNGACGGQLRGQTGGGLPAQTNGCLPRQTDRRLPGNVNVRFAGVEGESLLIRLDMLDICASAGSACTSGSLEPSHVLLAMGLSPEAARSSVRFTLGEDNTLAEIDEAVEAVKGCVGQLRRMRGYIETKK